MRSVSSHLQIKWMPLMNGLLGGVSIPALQPSENIVVYAPEYLEKLEVILADYRNTTEGKM